MLFRLLLCIFLATALTSCEAPYKKSDAAERKPLKDVAKDPTFQAFIERLRIAVQKKDRQMLASMMTQDFGWRWDDAPQGESPFDYWDKRKLWGELGEILRKGFEPNELYMVAPPEVMTNPSYAGYRAGMRLVGGSWRFAYFVPAPPPGMGAPAASAEPAGGGLQVPPTPQL